MQEIRGAVLLTYDEAQVLTRPWVQDLVISRLNLSPVQIQAVKQAKYLAKRLSKLSE